MRRSLKELLANVTDLTTWYVGDVAAAYGVAEVTVRRKTNPNNDHFDPEFAQPRDRENDRQRREWRAVDVIAKLKAKFGLE